MLERQLLFGINNIHRDSNTKGWVQWPDMRLEQEPTWTRTTKVVKYKRRRCMRIRWFYTYIRFYSLKLLVVVYKMLYMIYNYVEWEMMIQCINFFFHMKWIIVIVMLQQVYDDILMKYWKKIYIFFIFIIQVRSNIILSCYMPSLIQFFFILKKCRYIY